jgi:hypothetical protein
MDILISTLVTAWARTMVCLGAMHRLLHSPCICHREYRDTESESQMDVKNKIWLCLSLSETRWNEPVSWYVLGAMHRLLGAALKPQISSHAHASFIRPTKEHSSDSTAITDWNIFVYVCMYVYMYSIYILIYTYIAIVIFLLIYIYNVVSRSR